MPSHTIAQNLQRLQTARTNIASAITTKGGTVASGAGFEDFSTAIGTIPSGGSATLITKNISANGTYNASSDSADGYSSVTVAVPNTYTAGDEGKVVSNGSLVAQTAMPDTITTNGTYTTTEYNSVTVNVPTGGGSSLATTSMKPKLPDTDAVRWEPIRSSIKKNGTSVWTDGTNIYYSAGNTQVVFAQTANGPAFNAVYWTGLTAFNGSQVWTDGTDIYYSYYDAGNPTNYVLDTSTRTWSEKTWNGFVNLSGTYIWTDGTNIYYSEGTTQYVLDKSTSTWSTKTWSGLTNFDGFCMWTDGTNIYYSKGRTQYVLDKSTSTWSTKTWSGLTNFDGYNVWTDGTNIYHTYSSTTHVLNIATSTWSEITWTAATGTIPYNGSTVWTDGTNIYHCYEAGPSVAGILVKSTNTTYV